MYPETPIPSKGSPVCALNNLYDNVVFDGHEGGDEGEREGGGAEETCNGSVKLVFEKTNEGHKGESVGKTTG